MLQKAELIVEKFDEGITTRWNDMSGEEESAKSLALNGCEASIIGNSIWADVFTIFDKSGSDKVRIKLEYEVISSI